MAEFKTEFLATKELDIGEIIPDGKITIREPTRAQVQKIRKWKENEEKIVDEIMLIAPTIVIDHNVEKDGQKMDTKELLAALFESMRFTRIFNEGVSGFFLSPEKTVGA